MKVICRIECDHEGCCAMAQVPDTDDATKAANVFRGRGWYVGGAGVCYCTTHAAEKSEGATEEMENLFQYFHEILRHKNISPPMLPGVQDRLEERVAKILRERFR